MRVQDVERWLRGKKVMKMSIENRIIELERMGFVIVRKVRHNGSKVGDVHKLKSCTRICIGAPRGKYRTADCVVY